MICLQWMKCIPVATLLLFATSSSCNKDGEVGDTGKIGKLPEGKELYRPEDFPDKTGGQMITTILITGWLIPII